MRNVKIKKKGVALKKAFDQTLSLCIWTFICVGRSFCEPLLSIICVGRGETQYIYIYGIANFEWGVMWRYCCARVAGIRLIRFSRYNVPQKMNVELDRPSRRRRRLPLWWMCLERLNVYGCFLEILARHWYWNGLANKADLYITWRLTNHNRVSV